MDWEKSFRRGFSLIEMVVVIAMIGLIATISFAVVTQIHSAAEEEKLNSDAATLNRAVSAYLASGGSLDNAKTPADVLARLKSAATSEMRKRMPGFSSSLIDPRISIVMQIGNESAAGNPRALWNQQSQEFIVTDQGAPGVKEFILDDSLAETPAQTESRTSNMLYSKESNWVWDYQDRSNPGANDGPTVVSVVADPGTPPIPAGTPPSGTPPNPNPPFPPTGSLVPPVFSVPGGTYGINLYDLSLSISDPNPPGTSKVIYSVDFGNWQDYSGTITASPGSTVSAQSVALVSGWSDSGKIDHAYAATPATLKPPVISPNRDTFGLFYQHNINVSLGNSNQPGTSTTRYRVNGGAWQDYSDPFLLKRQDYPSGATIEAQAVSSGSPYYLASTVSSRTLSNESLNLTGNTSGEFHDPTGPSGMLTNLPSGSSSSYFEWGDGNGAGRSESWMDFAGSSFTDVAEGERFNIGSLTYYNGTIASGTGAETIDLDIALALDINGNIFNPYFDFGFELVNSPNSSDEWASADYVRLMDPRASRTLVINDNEFEFRLEFGETSADGFSLFDEFHVLENKDASVNIYGTFVSLGPVATSGDPTEGGTEIAETVDATAIDPTKIADPNDAVYQKEGYVDSEEGTSKYLDQLKSLVKIADDADDVAEPAADRAVLASQNAIKAKADGDDDAAINYLTETRTAADEVYAAAKIAQDAAVRAKILASEIDSIAAKDPSAQDEADQALIYAMEIIDDAQDAAIEVTRAENAVTDAEAAVGAFFDTGNP